MRSAIRRVLEPLRRVVLGDLHARAANNLFLTGRVASIAIRDLARVRDLSDVEFGVFSQWGEDGIIEWLVQRLGVMPRTFIEFGVENYVESNTRFLLQNRNWRGLVIDSSRSNVAFVRNDAISWRHDIEACCAFITRDNIDSIITKAGFGGEVGLLSIDIDGNDYWVWERIESICPVICICEYNAVFGDTTPISVPYDPEFVRTRAHFSNLYFGASITALRWLGEKKGYCFIGSNLAGTNAFFVRNDYCARLQGAIRDASPHPSFGRDSRDLLGNLTYLSGLHRLAAIRHLPVVNTVTQQRITLGSIERIYSEAWASQLNAPYSRTASSGGYLSAVR